MTTCSKCVHWAEHPLDRSYDRVVGLGVCTAPAFLPEHIAHIQNKTDGIYRQHLRCMDPSITMFVSDASGYQATLYTRPTHSCSAFKSKK